MITTNHLLTKGLLLMLLLALLSPALAEVYKTVDEDGNVTYTDQPPAPGAEPMDLPGLSVIKSLELPAKASSSDDAEEDGEAVTDIRELRRGYSDFRITSPKPEEHIRGTGNEVTIAWDARYQLQPGMKVHLFLDGEALEPTRNSSVTLEQVDRGEHTVTGKIVDARNRTIVNASPVTFFMHQFSVNFGNQAAPPANAQGGG